MNKPSNIVATVDLALMSLQLAMEKRRLYPPGHPRVAEAVSRSLADLTAVLAQRTTVEVSRVDDRIVVDNTTLASSQALVGGMFSVLSEAGIDRVTFRQGATAQAITSLVENLASRAARDQFASSESINFSFLSAPVEQLDLPAMAQTLEKIWGEFASMDSSNVHAVGGMVVQIMNAVGRHSHSLIPLADVRENDEYTFVHTTNVALLSTALGEAVGLSARTLEMLTESALLHDVGKTRIPAEILAKAGSLNKEERGIIDQHPAWGAAILMQTKGVSDLSSIVAFEHHMRLDGTGYPQVQGRWRPNLASQIVQVADIFDALRTHRSYRRALDMEQVIPIIREHADKGIDKALLNLFETKVISRVMSGVETPVGLQN